MLQIEPKPRVREGEPRVPPETMHDREQLGLEVACDLTLAGMATFLSTASKGVNLFATNAALTICVPVRIVAAGDRLLLKHDDAKLLSDAGGVVAFLVGSEDERERYYLPVADYLSKATKRDIRHSVEVKEHARWLRGFEGHAGVKRAFARLIKKPAARVGVQEKRIVLPR